MGEACFCGLKYAGDIVGSLTSCDAWKPTCLGGSTFSERPVCLAECIGIMLKGLRYARC